VVTRGAAAQGAFQVLSHVASKSLEEVLAAAEKGQKIGWQLYMHSDRYVHLMAVSMADARSTIRGTDASEPRPNNIFARRPSWALTRYGSPLIRPL
jgi:L-lactate dehydrogenase (cytochrome)